MLDILRLLEEEKTLVGSGAHKTVYTSPYTDVNIKGAFVEKTWNKYSDKENAYKQEIIDNAIKKEYEIYQKNKDIISPIVEIDFDKKYMIQKKLDTKRATDELEQLEEYIKPYYNTISEDAYKILPEFFEFLIKKPKLINAIKNNIQDTQLVETYKRWIEFAKKVSKMDTTYTPQPIKTLKYSKSLEDTPAMIKPRTYIVDFHKGNIGYDGDKLKFLDI
jgi:hypothetical protein